MAGCIYQFAYKIGGAWQTQVCQCFQFEKGNSAHVLAIERQLDESLRKDLHSKTQTLLSQEHRSVYASHSVPIRLLKAEVNQL